MIWEPPKLEASIRGRSGRRRSSVKPGKEGYEDASELSRGRHLSCCMIRGRRRLVGRHLSASFRPHIQSGWVTSRRRRPSANAWPHRQYSAPASWRCSRRRSASPPGAGASPPPGQPGMPPGAAATFRRSLAPRRPRGSLQVVAVRVVVLRQTAQSLAMGFLQPSGECASLPLILQNPLFGTPFQGLRMTKTGRCRTAADL